MLHVAQARNAYWDNAKGILMTLVVLGHYLYAYSQYKAANAIITIIYLFHMPAFVFISGFLSKSENATSAKSICKLCLVYMIFNTSMMLYSFIFEDLPLSLFTPYYSYWYILALIVWRLTVKQLSQIRGITIISIIVAMSVGFWQEVSNVFALARIFCFYPFFILGYKFSTIKINAFVENRTNFDYFKSIILLTITSYFVYLFILFSPRPDIFTMIAYSNPVLVIARLCIFAIAILMIISLGSIIPEREIPLLTKWGRNSLVIFLLHRYFTLIFVKILPIEQFNQVNIIYAVIASFFTLLLLGQNFISLKLSSFFDNITNTIFNDGIYNTNHHYFKETITIIGIIILLIQPIKSLSQYLSNQTKTNKIHTVMSIEQKNSLQDTIKIAFIGDMILLQDQVKKAYHENTGEYDFDSMFKYAMPYLSEADLAIGVFEGPTAGKANGYSKGNYDDGIAVRLNFPDSFARAVKKSGIDIVTTANNHLLDQGEEGAKRTLDILDQSGLYHLGSYRNENEKNSIRIIQVQGIRIAFLAYTFGCNYYDESYFFEKNKTITSIIVSPESKYFKEAKNQVLADFEYLKKQEPDVIIVLPHMGTQFSHKIDDFQKIWNEIFIKAGANIILGDHAHAVQPIELISVINEDKTIKKGIIVNCPGNFVNSYNKIDGDATALVNIYLQANSGDVICASVVPMWTESKLKGIYRALPIYDIFNNEELMNSISTYELDRIKNVQSLTTSVMLGVELPLTQLQPEYYLFPEGYVRQRVKPIEITEKMKETDFFKILKSAKKVCFVGDSITAGTQNGGYGWFEPVMAAFPDTNVSIEAWGGATTKTLLKNASNIAAHFADVYVVAVGTNDVRYRKEKDCAMDAISYVNNIAGLVKQITDIKPEAKFIFISPWPALSNDPHSVLPENERDKMLGEYSEALKQYCQSNGFIYSNPSPYINKILATHITSDYLIDHIHPNSIKGTNLYSRAVMDD